MKFRLFIRRGLGQDTGATISTELDSAGRKPVLLHVRVARGSSNEYVAGRKYRDDQALIGDEANLYRTRAVALPRLG